MKIIEGFEQAKRELSRSILLPSRVKVSPNGLFGGNEDAEQAVRWIIEQVRERRDAALYDLTSSYDGVRLDSLEVPEAQVKKAWRQIDPALLAAMRLAAERISAFHEAQKNAICHEVAMNGLRQLIRPLERVGVYAPGGTASYPSTVLMTAIPAKVAGVPEIILATPPKSNGEIPSVVLAAADIAGVNRVFRIGGAQAVAALAYGTESVPRVDKICGPGNIFVMLAKKQVFGVVAIDGLQGPSEALVIADDTSNPAFCASELLAQAEHDPLAKVVLVTTSRGFVDRVNIEVDKQLAQSSRRDIARQPLDKGIAAVVVSLDEAIELANLYAPEHLCLMIRNAARYIDKIKNAGCVVTGEKATVVLGDYVAGPSHALPTGGTARFSSPLSVADFLKFINVIDEDSAMINKLGAAASIIARAEGLDAHARAIEMRIEESG